MKKYILSLIFFLGAISTYAQSLSFQWAKRVGAFGDEYCRSMAIDPSGNVYTTGSFAGTVDFDPGSGTFNLTATNGGGFILKLNASGNFVWAKNLGGALGSSDGYSITVDKFGNIYTTGAFTGTIDFDPGNGVFNMTAEQYKDIFVSKLNSSGNFIWARQMGGLSDETGFAITTDEIGNIFTTGSFRETVDFNPGVDTFNLTSIASEDIFISKLDASGNFVWAKQMGGNGWEAGVAITVDIMGNLYATGRFEGTANFDFATGKCNLTSAGENDTYILKIDAAGNFEWGKRLGGPYLDFCSDIAVDHLGNVLITGTFTGTVDFDPNVSVHNITASGWHDSYILKLSNSGIFVWVKTAGGTSTTDAVGYSITFDISDNVYTTGFFSGEVDFDPGSGVFKLIGTNNIFILKLNTSGNFIWAGNMGAPAGGYYNVGAAIQVHTSGDVYSAGYFAGDINGIMDFDPSTAVYNLTSSGNSDIYIHKMQSCQLNYNVTLINAKLISNEIGADYQWVNCPAFTIIPGETSQFFNPSTNGDYAVIVTSDACKDTSACYTISNVGLNNNSLIGNINILPNPNNGKFKIQIPNQVKFGQVEIYNSVGVLIYSQTDIKKFDEIELINQPNGLYFVMIIANGKVLASQRIIIAYQ